MRIGYHVSHEQYAPSRALELAIEAERAGFEHAMCSDHLMPFSLDQGHSGFTWSWLGAALQATSMSFGAVTTPGYRYHPALVAQAAGTLAEMYPERFWLALGSGELLNEHVVGGAWPPGFVRYERLVEAAQIMRRLLTGERVLESDTFEVADARLFVRPAQRPLLYAAALSAESAARAGSWADGVVTTAGPREHMEGVISAFREHGGADKPVLLQAQHSWAPREADALDAAHRQWRFAVLDGELITDLRSPEQFDAATRSVRADEVAQRVRVSANLQKHAAWLDEYESLGFDAVYVHNVCREHQSLFLRRFGEEVLATRTASRLERPVSTVP